MQVTKLRIPKGKDMKLKKIEIGQFLFEVIKEGWKTTTYEKVKEITLRVINKSETNQPIEFQRDIQTMLVSCKYGMKISDWFEPFQTAQDGYSIVAKSFVDIGISFGKECKVFCDGDKIQIGIKNLCNIHIIKESSEWFFFDVENKQTNEDVLIETVESTEINEDALLETVECFEVLEENVGISIQNVSINVNDENSIDLFFEILGVDDKCKEHGFGIKFGIYDKRNKIRESGQESRFEGEFIGFEIFSFENIRLPMPVNEIGKIRIYPTKY